MRLNMSQFKKVMESSDAAILQHRDGHKIRIAKKALSDEAKKDLSRLPLYQDDPSAPVGEPSGSPDLSADSSSDQAQPVAKSEGQAEERNRANDQNFNTDFPNAGNPQGQAPVVVNVNNGPQPQQMAQAQPQQAAASNQMPQQSSGQPEYQLPAPPRAPEQDSSVNATQTGQAPQPPEQDASIPGSQEAVQQSLENLQGTGAENINRSMNVPSQANDPLGMQAYLQQAQRGLGEQQIGQAGEASAAAQQAQAMQPVYDQGAIAQQKLLSDYQNHFQGLDNERQGFISDVQNSLVDPNHYMESLSGGGKFATGLGIFLGALGAGTHGNPNQALGFVNQQIDRDINAQNRNLGAQENLLSANLKQFGNLKDAADMTRVMQSDVISTQLKAAANRSVSPLLKAKQLQLAGQLDMQAAPVMQGIAMKQALMKALNGGGSGSPRQDAQNLNIMRMLDPALAKNMESRTLPGPNGGMATIPIPQEVRDQLVARQQLDTQLTDIEKFAQEHQGATEYLSPAVYNEGQTRVNTLMDTYRQANKQGVFKDAEKDFVEGITGHDPTAFMAKWRTIPKYEALKQQNIQQMNQMRAATGLPSYVSPTDQSGAQGSQQLSRPAGAGKIPLGPPVVRQNGQQ